MSIRNARTRPAEIVAEQRRRRVQTLRLYAIACGAVLLVSFGGLTIYGAFLQAGIVAGQHVANGAADYARHNLPAAEREMRAAVAAKGDDYDARFDLGIVLLKEGRYRDALAELQRATAIDNQPIAYLYAGIAGLAMHRPDAASAEARRGLAIVPADPDLNAVLALADKALGQSARAAQEFATARANGYTGQTVRGWIAQASLAQGSGSGGGQ